MTLKVKGYLIDSLISSIAVIGSLKACNLPELENTNLLDSVKYLTQCISGLVSCLGLPAMDGSQNAEKFSVARTKITEAATALMISSGNPENIKKHLATIDEQSEAMRQAAMYLLDDPDAQRRLRELAERLGQTVTNILSVAPDAINDPTDKAAVARLCAAAQSVLSATENLARDGGPIVETSALYACTKMSSAHVSSLISNVQATLGKTSDPKMELDLLGCAQATSEALHALIQSLQGIPTLNNENAESTTQSLIGAIDQFPEQALQLVVLAKQAVSKINDARVKHDISIDADYTLQSIQSLVAQKNVLINSEPSVYNFPLGCQGIIGKRGFCACIRTISSRKS